MPTNVMEKKGLVECLLASLASAGNGEQADAQEGIVLRKDIRELSWGIAMSFSGHLSPIIVEILAQCQSGNYVLS